MGSVSSFFGVAVGEKRLEEEDSAAGPRRDGGILLTSFPSSSSLG